MKYTIRRAYKRQRSADIHCPSCGSSFDIIKSDDGRDECVKCGIRFDDDMFRDIDSNTEELIYPDECDDGEEVW